MSPDVLAATYLCPTCSFRASDLPVQINSLRAIDENVRKAGLERLRKSGFKRILTDLKDFVPSKSRILDVGCAHGWFLEMAKDHGYEVAGIEPDIEMADIAIKSGNAIIRGYFPDALRADEAFDVITFHDVFEHLPDVRMMLGGVAKHLKPGGHLVINLPMSDGLIYRISTMAARLGLRKPLSRMWQEGLPSPHLSYFSTATLRRLVTEEGFVEVARGRLSAIEIEGLRKRIGYDKTMSRPVKAMSFVAAIFLRPILRLFPSDIQYFIFKLN